MDLLSLRPILEEDFLFGNMVNGKLYSWATFGQPIL